ncbi:MAG TPA: alpha/beta hydrolase [Caulobacteraceae bacterium]|jgi:pimeloyl-ACP methyl ester carboxylesterase
MTETRFTRSGVRLRRHSTRPGVLNWLLLPGGPGIGSESLQDLADALQVPGTIWFVDLPGDGSNRSAPGAPADPFSVWPGAVVEAAQALPNPVFAGHSTGGMYLLDTPDLAPLLRGLALLDTAPDARWHPRFVEMTQAHPLPEVGAASAVYEADRRDENIAAIAVASAPWNFTPAGLEPGRGLLARMPHCSAAVDWSDAHFDHVYAARWWPTHIPILRLAGAQDRIVSQDGWRQPRFSTPNVIDRLIPDAGHFPWIENPGAVRAAFAELAARMGG